MRRDRPDGVGASGGVIPGDQSRRRRASRANPASAARNVVPGSGMGVMEK